MKKLFLFLAATLVMVSCGSDNEDGEPQMPSNEEMIIGKWVSYESVLAENYPNFHEATSKDTLVFRTDGTYTEVFEGSKSPINGTYNISNSRLLLGGLFLYDLIFDNRNSMILKSYSGYISKYKRLQ